MRILSARPRHVHLIALAAVSLVTATWAQSTKVKIYIEPKVNQSAKSECGSSASASNCRETSGTVDYSLKATQALMDKCPDLIIVTSDPPTADFTLRLQTGNSVLCDKAGNAVYSSHAARRLSNFAKDVCGFVKSLPPK